MEVTNLGFSKLENDLIVKELNVLLSNFQIYYQNLRGLHWNIRGKRFFDLHLKFEELYNDSQIKIDLIAERILTLEGLPLHTFSDYLKYNEIEIVENIFNDEKAVESIIKSIKMLLHLERNILKRTNEISDEGTNSMLSDFITEQEKTLWMLQAWLS